MKHIEPGSRWVRRREGTLLEEHVTVTGFSRSSDTFGRVFIQYRDEAGLSGTFYGLQASWLATWSPSE